MDEAINCGSNKHSENEIKTIARQVVDKIQAEEPEFIQNNPQTEQIAEKIFSFCMLSAKEEHHSGPLPSPRTLKKYNEIIPDGAERIMKVFEDESCHRRKMEDRVIKSQTNQSLSGQILGFFIATISIIVGTYLVIQGHDAAGITIFSLDIVGLAAVFVIGKKTQQKSLEE